MTVALVLSHADVRLTQRYYIDLRINDTAVDCFPVRGWLERGAGGEWRALAPMPLGANCVAYIDVGAFVELSSIAIDGSGSWWLSLVLPNAPSLSGSQFALQAAILGTAGPLGLDITNGLHLTRAIEDYGRSSPDGSAMRAHRAGTVALVMELAERGPGVSERVVGSGHAEEMPEQSRDDREGASRGYARRPPAVCARDRIRTRRWRPENRNDCESPRFRWLGSERRARP